MDYRQVYDVHTQVRQRLFDWIRPLSQEDYIRTFPFGLHTLRRTMIEIAETELYLAMRLREEPLPPLADWPISEKHHPTFRDLETLWEAQMPKTRATLSAITDWERVVESRLLYPDKTVILKARLGDIAMQLLLHEVHHRSQAM
ncbi:MAG: DinB family protein, partial [Armatimonadota bacterium]